MKEKELLNKREARDKIRRRFEMQQLEKTYRVVYPEAGLFLEPVSESEVKVLMKSRAAVYAVPVEAI